MSLSIFAVLTARTLYTYKYEVAINNDKVHRPALCFLSMDLLWSVTFTGSVGRPTCPAGRGTLRLLHTQVPQGTRCYGKRGAGSWLGWAPSFFGSQSVESWDWCVRHSFSWVSVWSNDSCSLNLDFSCPNMKNSDRNASIENLLFNL